MIEVHDDVRHLGLEVRGRIVESEVRVLADAGEAQIDRTGVDARVESLQFGGEIRGVGVDRDELGPCRQLVDETFAEILAETRAMRLREADIFVEVEDRDLGPVDARFLHEVLERLELARARGDDDVRARLTGEDGAQFAGAVRGRGLAHGDGVLMLLDLHDGVQPDCPSPPPSGKRLTPAKRRLSSD